ncbi:MAG: tetratricopeptide repeat protein [Rhodobacteraceae bacterium]|nr:tetratricopeptide repeat protein [Paracoccaceae bacterium]
MGYTQKIRRRSRLFVAKYWLRRAHQERDEAQWRTAAALYQRALTWDETRPGAWVQYGNMLREIDQLPQALEAYQRALALSPDDAEVHFQLGQIREKLGDPATALWSFQRALALAPKHERAAAGFARVKPLARRAQAPQPSADVEFAFEDAELI